MEAFFARQAQVSSCPWPLAYWPFPGGSDGKESVCSVGDLGSSLGWEDPLEKKMAIHSSILAWRIPWLSMEPGGLQSMGL